MNKTELLEAISKTSDVNVHDCEKVVNALEKVLEKEFTSSQGFFNAFDKVNQLLNLLRKKK